MPLEAMEEIGAMAAIGPRIRTPIKRIIDAIREFS
jgi:hypothetical protein